VTRPGFKCFWRQSFYTREGCGRSRGFSVEETGEPGLRLGGVPGEGGAEQSGEDVVDADFEEVDEDNQKRGGKSS